MSRKNLDSFGLIVAVSWATDRRRFLIGASFVVLGAAAMPVAALLVRGVTNLVLGHGLTLETAISIGLLALCLTAQLLLSHFGHLWYFELGEKNEIELTLELSRRLDGLSTLDQVESRATANLVALIREDIASIRATLEALIVLFATVAQIIATSVLLASLSPILLVLPLAAAAPVIAGRLAQAPLESARENLINFERQARQLREAATKATGLKEVRLGGAGHRVTAAHARAQNETRAITDVAFVQFAAVRSAGQALFAATLIGSIVVVYQLFLGGSINAGQFVMFFALLTQIGGQVASAVAQLTTASTASAGLRRLRGLEDAFLPAKEAPEEPSGCHADGVVVSRVSRTYESDAPMALRDVSFEARAGSTIAIVGENGAGKSTLVRMLVGLDRPSSGRICISTAPGGRFWVDSSPALSSALFQDFLHLDLTVRETIGAGDVARMNDDRAIEAAASRAAATGLVDEVGGLGAYIGRGYRPGRELSGGQWQSMGLARALMRTTARVVALDEPGHSLDPEAEVSMIRAYERAAKDMAKSTGSVVFYVTHRMSSVRSADAVLVLRRGQVEAFGPHAVVYRMSAYYRDLYDMQARIYRSDR